jgi:hypothetical protein
MTIILPTGIRVSPWHPLGPSASTFRSEEHLHLLSADEGAIGSSNQVQVLVRVCDMTSWRSLQSFPQTFREVLKPKWQEDVRNGYYRIEQTSSESNFVSLSPLQF